MVFLAVLVAFIISLSVSGHSHALAGAVGRWHQWLQNRGLNEKLVIAVYALLPAVVLAVVLRLIGSGLIEFVVAIGLLLLAFRSSDQPDTVVKFQQHLEAGAEKEAWQLAVDELGLASEMYEPGDEAIVEGVQAGLAYQFLERFFVAVFWFVAFGAPGVLLIWLMSMALQENSAVGAFYYRVKHALYWIPVRLMTLTLALVGNFTNCFTLWVEQVRDFERDDRVLLISCLKAAVGEHSSDNLLQETLQVLRRSQYAWLVVLALMLIFG